VYKKLIIILAVVLLGLLADRFIFTSSDVKISLKPEILRASRNSEMQIRVFRSNLLNFKVPFSSVEVRFVIEEGGNLIELSGESSEGTVNIRSKGIEGEASVGIYSLKSGLQIKKILIKILPRDVAFRF
jgi:hypothetical protein